VRYLVAVVLAGAVLTPALLASAWRTAGGPALAGSPLRRRSPVVLLAAVPVVVLTLITAWPPAFKTVSATECVRPARPAETRKLEIVYGRFDELAAADVLARRARAVGYADAQALPDGCGRWKVVNPAVDSYSGGAAAVEEGRRAGLNGVLELAG
jgi:hypothetical protein